jgi:hypothetical protein
VAENVGFVPATWNPTAEELLEDATGSNPSYTVAELKAEVESGRAHLFAVIDRQPDKDSLLGFVVMWIEAFGGGREMVLQAGAALLQKTESTLAYVQPAFARLAKENRCTSIRVHVERRALIRKFKSLGWDQAEVVMRREV